MRLNWYRGGWRPAGYTQTRREQEITPSVKRQFGFARETSAFRYNLGVSCAVLVHLSGRRRRIRIVFPCVFPLKDFQMNKMLVLATLVAAVSLAACGKKEEPAPAPAPAPVAAPAPAPAPAPEMAASTAASAPEMAASGTAAPASAAK
jgi:hypothetical protein